MRISDWSSDVCSSDLPRVRDYPAEQRVIGADGLGAVARPRPFRRWLMCFVWAVAPSVVWSWQWLPALQATEGSILRHASRPPPCSRLLGIDRIQIGSTSCMEGGCKYL